MSEVLKRARVRHIFGGEEAVGWVPPNAARPNRTPEVAVDLEVAIIAEGHGFVLQWDGPTAECSGDNWYQELADAEHAAVQSFGIAADAWQVTAPVSTNDDHTARGQARGHVMQILFVCSQNRLRSLTAEKIFDGVNGHQVRSAGTEEGARIRVTGGHIGWADIIFVMEKRHLHRLQEKFREELSGKHVVCLYIPDDYEYMDEALIERLRRGVDPYVEFDARTR